MRKFLIGLLSLVAVSAVSLSQAGPALAADNVSSSRCREAGGSLGTVCIRVYFDNTNCDADSENNCSGRNGASVTRIDIFAEDYIDISDVQVSLDFHGDGTTAFARKATLVDRNFTYQDTSLGLHRWRQNIYEAWFQDINRVCVRVEAYDTAQAINIGGVNPYGLSMAGACGLPY